MNELANEQTNEWFIARMDVMKRWKVVQLKVADQLLPRTNSGGEILNLELPDYKTKELGCSKLG